MVNRDTSVRLVIPISPRRRIDRGAVVLTPARDGQDQVKEKQPRCASSGAGAGAPGEV